MKKGLTQERLAEEAELSLTAVHTVVIKWNGLYGIFYSVWRTIEGKCLFGSFYFAIIMV